DGEDVRLVQGVAGPPFERLQSLLHGFLGAVEVADQPLAVGDRRQRGGPQVGHVGPPIAVERHPVDDLQGEMAEVEGLDGVLEQPAFPLFEEKLVDAPGVIPRIFPHQEEALARLQLLQRSVPEMDGVGSLGSEQLGRQQIRGMPIGFFRGFRTDHCLPESTAARSARDEEMPDHPPPVVSRELPLGEQKKQVLREVLSGHGSLLVAPRVAEKTGPWHPVLRTKSQEVAEQNYSDHPLGSQVPPPSMVAPPPLVDPPPGVVPPSVQRATTGSIRRSQSADRDQEKPSVSPASGRARAGAEERNRTTHNARVPTRTTERNMGNMGKLSFQGSLPGEIVPGDPTSPS